MSNTNSMYASRKRRKPVQKSVKPTPLEGAKSNPSKRHRDRLNAELERLAGLLPFPTDVVSKLDKLSVLRLSVSYLRAKSFFNVALKSKNSKRPNGNGVHDMKPPGVESLEGELLLQVLNGFVIVVTADGTVFYTSSTIQDYLGFHQSDVIHQSAYDFIHTEDRAEFQHQLHWALNPLNPDSLQADSESGAPVPITYYSPEQLPPENSAFLERNFVCRLRCLLDNSSGFLAMNFQGHLKFLHGQNKTSKDGTVIPPQLALFALATPLQPPSILEIRTKNFIFRTKHKLDFTPTACDPKGKVVLGYTDAELCYRGTGYQFIHAADMLYCAENHVRMMKTGESGMTIFRLLTKNNRWTWVQANARLVYKNGRPDYIIATQRALTDEEGMENFKKRNLKLPFSFATGEAMLYETNFSLSLLSDATQCNGKGTGDSSNTREKDLDPNSLLGALLKQDESVYVCAPAQSKLSFESSMCAGDMGGDANEILSCDWQDNILSVTERSVLKREQNDSSIDGRNSDLFSFMKNLGISLEDLELLQQDEEFLRIECDDPGDLTQVADEILSYVQESLNKRPDCMYSSAPPQPQPFIPNSSCMLQQPPPPTPQLPVQQQQQQQQQQLCQKMKRMQVNSMCTTWLQPVSAPPANSQQPPPLLYVQQPHVQPQQDLQYGHYRPQSIVPEFPYKNEMDVISMAYNPNFMPYKTAPNAVPRTPQLPSTLANPTYTVNDFSTQDLEDFLETLDPSPNSQRCAMNAQDAVMAPQPCYAGAMSMYHCLPETNPTMLGPPNQMNPMMFEPVSLEQHPLLTKLQFQNGNDGNMAEGFPESFSMIESPQPTPPLNLPQRDPWPYPDLMSRGVHVTQASNLLPPEGQCSK
ncbi:aryl hydrocarbon receptor [Amia ocellicauda]|uniref:aryl hydrocarbon receptor n=1 Tax=Amia ocellicauda TaxID=2972642 RepID=UPI003463EB41